MKHDVVERHEKSKVDVEATTSTATPTGISTRPITESDGVALEIHPIAKIFPAMTEAEFGQLVADIEEHGQHEAIVLFEGKILDGVHRYGACRQLGLSPKVKQFAGNAKAALAYAVSANLKRRHMNESQRAIAAASIASFAHGGDRSKSSIADLVTQQQAADLLNVSKASVERAGIVVKEGTPEDVAAVTAGKTSMSATAKKIRIKSRQKSKAKARSGAGAATASSPGHSSSRTATTRSAPTPTSPSSPSNSTSRGKKTSGMVAKLYGALDAVEERTEEVEQRVGEVPAIARGELRRRIGVALKRLDGLLAALGPAAA